MPLHRIATITLVLLMPLPAAPSEPLPAVTSEPPADVDLRPALRAFGLPPRAQGDRPTCSVFVVTGALELALARLEGRGRRLSVEFLNRAANRVAGDRKDGAFFSDLWNGFRAHGICAEETLPYAVPSRSTARDFRKAMPEARAVPRDRLRVHWIKEWDPKKGITRAQLDEVRRTLAAGWPVCGGFLWPRKAVWTGGVLGMAPRDAVRDGHSVLLVGYRDDPEQPGGGLARIWNSSGVSRDGFLTYEYLLAYMNDAVWIGHAGGDAAGSRPRPPQPPGRQRRSSSVGSSPGTGNGAGGGSVPRKR